MAEELLNLADDPFHGRRPTSHERMTGEPWDASYSDGPPPWGIGEAQPAVVRLAAREVFAGSVLDAGCGTGENALHLASLGVPVLGVDVAERALATARTKAAGAGLEAEFALADAFHLDRLGRRFDSALDCGLFHTFESYEQQMYAASLASVVKQAGRVFVLCFGDEGADLGPHPVSQAELRAAFSLVNGWQVISIEPERIETRYHPGGVSAWLATIRRV